MTRLDWATKRQLLLLLAECPVLAIRSTPDGVHFLSRQIAWRAGCSRQETKQMRVVLGGVTRLVSAMARQLLLLLVQEK